MNREKNADGPLLNMQTAVFCDCKTGEELWIIFVQCKKEAELKPKETLFLKKNVFGHLVNDGS